MLSDESLRRDGLSRPPAAGGPATAPHARPVWPLALTAALVAALIAVPAFAGSPHWLGRLSQVVTGSPLRPEHAVVLALALALVARGALLRRRAAWYGLVTLALLGLLAVVSGDDPPWRLPLLAAALGGLWLERGRFPVRPHPERVRTAVKTGALLLAATTLLSLVLGGVSVRSVGDVASGLGATGAPMDGASWLPGVLGLAGAAGLLVLVITLLAPDPAPPPGDEAERARVASLVLHPGSDTLAPFALRRDKAYVFSADGRAAIGYRVLFGMAVAGGDPVGDPASHADAVRAFLAMCRTTGWRPAVLGASGALLPAWGPCRSIGFGDEVVIRPAEFTLSGRKMRNVRQAVKRTENFGVSSEILPERELTPALRDKLLDVASHSLGGAAERGFSMNLDELLTGYHPGAIVAIAYGDDKEPIAFQRYVTAGEGISLDAMRRDPGGPNGVNERLIVEMVDYAAERGHGVVSLNFAAFRELLDSDERGLLEKAGYRALHLLDPWIAVESLYLFDKKFRPSYKPRSVVFRSWFDIAWLAAALLTLEFGRTRPAQRAAGPVTEPVHHLGRS
ncbi:bifunctional lysylphosphatidylglycerol flippase/synthetase MprF [Actinomadura luteofluorescens]|uniref:Lysyl-tRNA synthetase class 2 n=1 Tax=Actinomadura luteofluorescens TaxID=46163 RepID=A0A7Y9EE13_9ACTN|nr:phosphatidylglycerol lysyltransferase domain-containing protein [Actinomadura luteofluorescens]NYD45917.1 lysyl-tRNA synthetase class 2 [Actinomadura luteofluorescens]